MSDLAVLDMPNETEAELICWREILVRGEQLERARKALESAERGSR